MTTPSKRIMLIQWELKSQTISKKARSKSLIMLTWCRQIPRLKASTSKTFLVEDHHQHPKQEMQVTKALI